MKWKCSYCGKTTHTRRTCSRLKSDKEWLTRANIKFRKAAVELMMTHGYGPGTLLEHVVTVYGEHDLISRCPVMITGVDWDQIEPMNDRSPPRRLNLHRLQHNRLHSHHWAHPKL